MRIGRIITLVCLTALALGASTTTALANVIGLAVTVPPGALSPFGPGATATTTGVLTVTSPTASWTLQVADATTASPARGHLVRSGTCSRGVAYLGAALSLTATPASGTSSGSKSVGASPVTVATGPAGTIPVTTDFRQMIGGAEPLEAGCAYSIVVTYTVS